MNKDQQVFGVFSQPGYISIGDKYPKTHHSFVPFNAQSGKGKQMGTAFHKQRSAHQDGYFDNQFKRVFEKEAYHDRLKAKRLDRMQKKRLNIGGNFIPTDAEKTRNGAGMHFGTLSGPIEHFSAQDRPLVKGKQVGKNFYTNPGKKGIGWGYVNVTLGGEYPHKDEKYDRSKELYSIALQNQRSKIRDGAFKLNSHPVDYFNENPYRSDVPLGPIKDKKIGGGKSGLQAPFLPSNPGKNPAGAKLGTFDPYPSHSADQYKPRVKRSPAPRRNGNLFTPQPRLKSKPVRSILAYNVNAKTNKQNYNTIRKVVGY